MLINRLIKMYGLRHKHIRIEDQQSNLKINTMFINFEYVNKLKGIEYNLKKVILFYYNY